MTLLKIRNQRNKRCVIKRKLKFEDCKNCLKVNKLEGKISEPEKNEIDVGGLKKYHKEFLKNKKF